MVYDFMQCGVYQVITYKRTERNEKTSRTMQNANSNIMNTNNMYLPTGIHLSTFVPPPPPKKTKHDQYKMESSRAIKNYNPH
jgi:hypothetical protein